MTLHDTIIAPLTLDDFATGYLPSQIAAWHAEEIRCTCDGNTKREQECRIRIDQLQQAATYIREQGR